MNKRILKLMFFTLVTISMTSCYTYTFTVGDGAQSGATVTQKNHYFIFGLAPGKLSDPNEMADNADDYKVTVEHTFVDGLLNAITFGIYTPTTTTVQK